MTVPYTFATANSPIPLEELDVNFATPITLGTTPVVLGGTYPDFGVSGSSGASGKSGFSGYSGYSGGGGAASGVSYNEGGSGAVTRTVQAKLQESISVKDFGATGDGSTNDTTAINNALSAVYSTGQGLYFPAGNYIYNGAGNLGNGVVIHGDGENATLIYSALSSPSGGYLFNAYGYGSGIQGMGFQANTTQTGGSYVVLSGPQSFISEFEMNGDYNGILMTGNVSRIRHGRFQNGASGAIRIRAEGGDNSQLIEDVLMGAQEPQISAAGIRVRNSAALIISNTSVIEQGVGLLVDPYSSSSGASDSGNVESLYVLNCFFDTSSNNGIRITPTGNASVIRCRFADVWTGSATNDGIYINNSGSGLLQGMHFESCHSVLNGGAGLTTGGTVSDIVVNGGEFCQNLYGVYFNNGATHVRVENATVGAGAGLSGNSSIGIVVNSGCDYFTITGNDLSGNGATLSIPATNNRYVNNNLGMTSPDVAAGNSSNGGGTTTISHNLGVAPQPYNIIISPNSGWSDTIYVNTTTITSTTFQVGGGSGYFAWQAKIGN